MRKFSKLAIALSLALAAISVQPVAAKADSKDVICLAKNVYFESRGESLAGKLAVAKVTLNRTKHADFPSTVCEVVYQPGQFSWTRHSKNQIKDGQAWQESLDIARQAVSTGVAELRNFTAVYFHSGSKPKDWGHVKLVAKIGKHKFYSA